MTGNPFSLLFSAAIQSSVARSEAILGKQNVFPIDTEVGTFDFDDALTHGFSVHYKSTMLQFQTWLDSWLHSYGPIVPERPEKASRLIRPAPSNVPMPVAVVREIDERVRSEPSTAAKSIMGYETAVLDRRLKRIEEMKANAIETTPVIDGKLKLDTPLPVSTRASIQNPTKLGLKPNQTIIVEDAIKGLVTKSANDAAVVVAEAIGGSEEEFAALMTMKARALGMIGTTYVNASGLPADAQITTARDQALLGRAVQQRFPVYYQYFATPSFRYKGAEMRNHNNLLGNVQGVDGIKTGYTEASGYNLTSSVRRDQRHIVAVVLGGTSNGARDARMRQLIEECIVKASTEQTAPMIVEVNDPLQQESPRAYTVAPAAKPTVAMGDTDGAATNTKVEPVPVPRPRALAAKPPAHHSKLSTRSKATPARASVTAKASMPAVYTLSSTPQAERRAGPSAY